MPTPAHGVDALLDLGSGGGYPGLPLALALPARRTLLVESVAKKAAFLSAAAGLLRVDAGPATGEIEVFNGRAEALAEDRRHRERWPAVVARAIAALPELAEVALPLVTPGGLLVAWKRRPLDAELDAADRPRAARRRAPPGARSRRSWPGSEGHVLVVVDRPESSAIQRRRLALPARSRLQRRRRRLSRPGNGRRLPP